MASIRLDAESAGWLAALPLSDSPAVSRRHTLDPFRDEDTPDYYSRHHPCARPSTRSRRAARAQLAVCAITRTVHAQRRGRAEAPGPGAPLRAPSGSRRQYGLGRPARPPAWLAAEAPP